MNQVENMLMDIELHHDVKVLYACEAGSRAYGFATDNSDYDIRFIYIAPLKEYLSLKKKEDTITLQDDLYDIQGWDLKKALLLACKSNPSLYEWMLSPIIYKEFDHSMLSLKNVVLRDYSKKVLAYHYANMAKKNIQEWSRKKESSYLIHAARASMMLEQIFHYHGKTIHFQNLVEKSNIFSKDELALLFLLKVGEDVKEHPFINEIATKTSRYILSTEESLVKLEEGAMNSTVLEKLFFQQLGIEGECDHKN
ncbi:nucleotidyltransferase domain-containing protein [Sutcliffiella horikoshii]|uniref:nucleotidyltransferase domain-containing protein n=1 Tax=Sutcliffiella horikoshii TaxID=79883 RepID=UPI00384ACA3C